jgi:hypothetical protein
MKLGPLVAGTWTMRFMCLRWTYFRDYNDQESTDVSRCQEKSNGDNDYGYERHSKSGRLDRE